MSTSRSSGAGLPASGLIWTTVPPTLRGAGPGIQPPTARTFVRTAVDPVACNRRGIQCRGPPVPVDRPGAGYGAGVAPRRG